MEGGGPGPGSRAQMPFLKTVLSDMQSAGFDPRSLRRIGSGIYLDDLIPLAMACAHSSDCRRIMRKDHQKGGIQLSIKMLNDEKILSAYQELLTPYNLSVKVCDADNLYVKHFKDYGLKPEVEQSIANSVVPASLVVTVCVQPMA